MEVTQVYESDWDYDSEDFWSEETEDIRSNHCLNLAIEYYLIAVKAKDKVSILY